MNFKFINSRNKDKVVIVDEKILIDCKVPFRKLQAFYSRLQLVLLTGKKRNCFNAETITQLAHLNPKLRFCCYKGLVKDLLNCGIKKKQIDIYDFKTGDCDNNRIYIKLFQLSSNLPIASYKICINKKISMTINHIDEKECNICILEASDEKEKKLKECTSDCNLFNREDNAISMSNQSATPFTKKLEILNELLNKAGKITMTEYELNEHGIYACIEELINAYEHIVEKLEMIEQDLIDNYRPLSKKEQYE